jgi:hypothetical protein
MIKKKILIYGLIGIIILLIVLGLSFLNIKNDSKVNLTINYDNNISESKNTTKIDVDNTFESKNTKTENYTFIQTITYSDENTTSKIIRNKLLKTATIEITAYYDENEMVSGFMDLRELSTLFTCNLFQMGIFDKNGLDESIKEWNSQEYTIEDDSPETEKETTILDPLEGYIVTTAKLNMNYKSGDKISECTMTGKEENQINIVRYYELS